MDNGKEKLQLIRKEAKEIYDSFRPVYCPYLTAEVHFTSEGFNHIRYDKTGERKGIEQEMRYKLIHLPTDVLDNSKTLQEYDEAQKLVPVKVNKKTEFRQKCVQYYGFIAIIGSNPKSGMKIKVIVRKVGNGEFHFWSIIPNWQTRKSKESGNTFQNHYGNLEED